MPRDGHQHARRRHDPQVSRPSPLKPAQAVRQADPHDEATVDPARYCAVHHGVAILDLQINVPFFDCGFDRPDDAVQVATQVQRVLAADPILRDAIAAAQDRAMFKLLGDWGPSDPPRMQ